MSHVMHVQYHMIIMLAEELEFTVISMARFQLDLSTSFLDSDIKIEMWPFVTQFGANLSEP